jgi:hypothetical protein
MKSLNTKLVLSALGFALIATPVMAQTSVVAQPTHRHVQPTHRQVHAQYQAPSRSSGEFGGGVNSSNSYDNTATATGVGEW